MSSTEPVPPSSSEVQAEDWQIQRDALKAEGDAAYRSKKFADAITFYSQAVSCDPQNHILLSNRSAAHLQGGNKSKALQDAKQCIQHMPASYAPKAYSRLAAAQVSLGRHGDAIESYEQILKVDSSHAIAQQGVKDCRSQLEKKQLEEAEEAKQQRNNSKSEGAAKLAEGSDEDDLLDDFFSEVETTSAPKQVAHVGPTEISNQKKGLGTAKEQIDRLLVENYKWKNLNPFQVLGIPHTSTEDDISRRYKALSLLLHPDKCSNLAKAKEAYDEVQRAKLQLDDPAKAQHVRDLVHQGMKQGKSLWQQQQQSSSNKRQGGGGESLEAMQDKEVLRIFAEIEYKRREVEKRERNFEQRERQQEEDELDKERKERQFDKNWREENRVDKRIGNWRDFQKKKKHKS